MGSLQRDPSEIRELLENLESDGTISFEEFIDLMQNVENKIVSNQNEGTAETIHQQ